MIETKLFEIRDRMTFILAMAIRFGGDDEAVRRKREGEVDHEGRLLWRAGYAPDVPYTLLIRLVDGEASCDPFIWRGGRTMKEAHIWIHEHWAGTLSGDVVDVEFILGETKTPKTSEVE